MFEIRNIIKQHLEKYPAMQPTDAVKLIYQGEFGGGHILKDKESAKAFLFSEFEKTEQNDAELISDIGGDFCRINLCAMTKAGISPGALFRVFAASAEEASGSIKCFEEKLEVLKELCQEGLFGFGIQELTAYLEEYKKAGYPPVSHSREYHDAYSPAYRVVKKEYARLLIIVEKTLRRMQEKEPVIIGIDGRSGSGKTTLSGLLSKLFDCEVIHMDDFFLPPELRTEERYAQAGGNIHYERFVSEIAEAIRAEKEINYRVFDCGEMDYSGWRRIRPVPLIVIEGVYSMHNLYSDIYDFSVFMDIEPEEQKRRIIERNGDYYRVFEEKWIPLENRYFTAMDIKVKSSIIIK